MNLLVASQSSANGYYRAECKALRDKEVCDGLVTSQPQNAGKCDIHDIPNKEHIGTLVSRA
jgi:hypothetical protein